ncbi:MAG: class I SAM-dependent methyltransferase [Verrucomicrobiota bacterium]
MKFFDHKEIDDTHFRVLEAYDAFIRSQIPENYDKPIRMRDWELSQVLYAIGENKRYSRALDTGSVNTFLSLWLTQVADQAIASDLLGQRIYKNILRRLRILPRKPTEANIETWLKAIKAKSKVPVKNVDLTQIKFPDDHFDLITSISVVEHIPRIEAAIAEMYRILAPGGKLLITTDCTPQGKPLERGVRYFTHQELKDLFSPYPVTSQVRAPDFRRENWCYHKDQPLLTTFIQIEKPAK